MAGTIAVLRATPYATVLAALPYALLISVGLAGWVTYDARRLQLRQYQTSLAWHPVVVFLLVALSPIVVFPWYLTVRERVLCGQVPRRRTSPDSRHG